MISNLPLHNLWQRSHFFFLVCFERFLLAVVTSTAATTVAEPRQRGDTWRQRGGGGGRRIKTKRRRCTRNRTWCSCCCRKRTRTIGHYRSTQSHPSSSVWLSFTSILFLIWWSVFIIIHIRWRLSTLGQITISMTKKFAKHMFSSRICDEYCTNLSQQVKF